MALFRKASDTNPNPNPAPEAGVQIDYDIIVNRVTENLRPFFRRQENASPVPVDDSDNDDDTMTPEEREKADRRAAKAAAKAVEPYAQVFTTAMPQYARDHAVSKLTEGEKLVYNEHKDEVDNFVSHAVQTNPAEAGNPMLHERAIQLMLGRHTDKIARYAVQYMTEEELPPAFAKPKPEGEAAATKIELSPMEKHSLEYFQTRRNGSGWNEENYKYYQSIKPGFLHEMVAEHKSRQKKEE